MRRLSIAIGLTVLSAVAQTNRGGIAGTVTDSSGAIIPGATLTITNLGTNQTQKTATSGSGAYTIQDLEPVHYKVEVDATGFAKGVAEDVKVDTVATATVDIRLQPKNAKTEVTVRERFRFKLRVDLLNALNHPNFGVASNYGGSEDLFTGAPSTAVISAANYDSWAKTNGQPLSTTTPGAAQLAQVQSFVTGNRNAAGALPANFFTVPLPAGFSSMSANNFDIRTLNGYKLYALRNVYDSNFGALSVKSSPRYIQFGLKVSF